MMTGHLVADFPQVKAHRLDDFRSSLLLRLPHGVKVVEVVRDDASQKP